MTNFSFIPSHWANIAQTLKESVYEQIETLDKERAELLIQLKAMLK
jgi:hypothetical protein